MSESADNESTADTVSTASTSDYSDSDTESDYEPDWAECNCARVDENGRCKCKKEPAWALDSAGAIKSSVGFIDINTRLQVKIFHQTINTRPYFKSGKLLKLGDIVPMHGNHDNIVVGWTKDNFITMPTVKKYGEYRAEEGFFDAGEPEKIKGRVDLQPMLEQLAEGIRGLF